MNAESIAAVLDADIEQWYEAQRKESTVNRNVMAVGLIMCEHMSTHFPLEEAKWFTGSQVSLLGGNRIKSILARHGEKRPFASEGGRTSRGSQDLARSFQETVNESSAAGEFEALAEADKLLAINILQAKMTTRVQADFYNRQRLPLEVDLNKQTRRTIEGLLFAAKDKGGNNVGAVAQHLVGATLEIRHIDLVIENQSYTTADQQTGRAGDFMVNDTAIHVTVAPTEALVAKCRTNLEQGFRPMVLTLEDRVGTARSLADNIGIEDRVAVRGIEEFIASNIDEVARYSEPETRRIMRQLFERYNTRVQAAEPDPSLLVEIPENL
ncbi:MAG: DUF4928 family protein [bacterium]|nr:DUF4928 family protein [bacterium]